MRADETRGERVSNLEARVAFLLCLMIWFFVGAKVTNRLEKKIGSDICLAFGPIAIIIFVGAFATVSIIERFFWAAT